MGERMRRIVATDYVAPEGVTEDLRETETVNNHSWTMPYGNAELAEYPLLERDAQVGTLRALAESARCGCGRFVVIEGSAGIGKTRLLSEMRAIADPAGIRVLA